jgi:ubiquinone/menaquinone biosynthesis C-methylase UbiE
MTTRDEIISAQFGDRDAVVAYTRGNRGPSFRFNHLRMNLVADILAARTGGDLLDVGCGPGEMVRRLVTTRPGVFRITALDRSPAMVRACLRAAGTDDISALTGRIEEMPLPSAGFDVVLAMGVLEYADIGAALAEMARVTRDDGLVLATMLNPASPYRFVQFRVLWPVLRALRAVEAALGVPPARRHGRVEHGIRTYPARTLRGMLARAGLRPVDTLFFDATLVMPPLDRLLRRLFGPGTHPEPPIRRGWRKRVATGYLVVARKV